MGAMLEPALILLVGILVAVILIAMSVSYTHLVTPYVSEDRQITLEIEFEQTEFTDRTAEDAPPGTAM